MASKGREANGEGFRESGDLSPTERKEGILDQIDDKRGD